MLELGKAGEHGTGGGVVPVLADGRVVATLQTSNWRTQAVAVVGDRSWTFDRRKQELVGRWTPEPADAVRVRARQTSMWKGTWEVDLEGTVVTVESDSYWKGTHRVLAGGRQVAGSGTVGTWSPRPTLTADPQVPLDHQVFLLWLLVVISRRNTSTMAAATGAIVIAGGSS
ncbi:hypothetical protein ASG41_12935 [Modestobacter sp. Leaf380]|nr:hypothetical protein ASG41_12935 [Modestobacter sp. Leaf380]